MCEHISTFVQSIALHMGYSGHVANHGKNIVRIVAHWVSPKSETKLGCLRPLAPNWNLTVYVSLKGFPRTSHTWFPLLRERSYCPSVVTGGKIGRS